jgi:exonuclease III
MKIFHQNVRNLQRNLNHVTSLLNLYKHIDIFALTETHISTEPEKLFEIPGYTFLSRNRINGKGGGVGMYISNDIQFERRQDLENDKVECIWIEILCKSSKNFLVCCLYKPPANSRYLPNYFNEHLRDMLSIATAGGKEIIALGDVNVNYLKKEDNKKF